MAPELIMGQKVTNTIDCYSFGCIVTEIIYELTCYWDYKVTTEQAVRLFFFHFYSFSFIVIFVVVCILRLGTKHVQV